MKNEYNQKTDEAGAGSFVAYLRLGLLLFWVIGLAGWLLLPPTAESRLRTQLFEVPIYIWEYPLLLAVSAICVCSLPKRPWLLVIASGYFAISIAMAIVAESNLSYVFVASIERVLPFVAAAYVDIKPKKARLFLMVSLGIIFFFLAAQVILASANVIHPPTGPDSKDEYEGVIRSRSTAGAPTATGYAIVLLLAALTSLVTRQRYRLMIATVGMIAAGLTLTRGAVFACAVLWLVCVLTGDDRRILWRKGLIVGVAICGVLMVAPMQVGKALQERIARSSDSNDERTQIIKNQVGALGAHVFGGRGIGTETPSYRMEQVRHGAGGYSYYQSHNILLSSFMEIGVIGSIGLLVALVLIIYWRCREGAMTTEIAIAAAVVAPVFLERIYMQIEFSSLAIIACICGTVLRGDR